MARGSFGAVRLAAARPNFINRADRSHPMTITQQNFHVEHSLASASEPIKSNI